MDDVVLALDQGTTSTKALLIDAGLSVRGTGAATVAIERLTGGRVEQDPSAIWQSCLAAIDALRLEDAGLHIAALAVSNQRESVLAWDIRTGEPLSPLLSWQDQRTAPWVHHIPSPQREAIRSRTGLELDPMFSAPKMSWLVQQVGSGPEVRVGTLDAWLAMRLTGSGSQEPHCEAGNASRTLLFDIAEMAWHDELLSIFEIPASALPQVQASDSDWGRTSKVPGIPDGVPLRAVLADSHAALFGHWALVPQGAGAAKATYGTGSSVMAPIEHPRVRRPGVSTTVAWVTDDDGPQWALEGNILYAGSGLDWLARVLGVGGASALSALAASVDSSDGAVFVPALNGLGAPWWAGDAAGTITGLTARTQTAHVARAGMESVAHQVCDVLDAMGHGNLNEPLHAGGGATASDLLMQAQADLAGREVLVAPTPDISALGAAVMAGRAVGLPMSRCTEGGPAPRTFSPTLAVSSRKSARRAWLTALRRAGVPAITNATPAPAGATTEGARA